MDVRARPSSAPTGVARVPAWAYAWWLVIGALAGFGVASLLTIGVLLLLAAAVLAGTALAVPVLRSRAVVAVPAGVAVVVAYLAWLNRAGPGEVCRTTSTTQQCSDTWSPWPFVAVALVLVLASLVLARYLRPGAAVGPR